MSVRPAVGGRRDEIVAATAELLERIGLADIRVADVAQAMGVSTALVFYHFRSKDALVAEAFAHSFARDLADLDVAMRGSDPMAKLRRVCALFDEPHAMAGWQTWTDACAVAQREPTMRARLREIDRRYTEALCRVIEEGVAAGVLRCADPTASALRVLALNDGLSTAVMVLGSVSLAQFREWMLALIATEVGVEVATLVTHRRGAPPRPGPRTRHHAAQPTD